MLRRKLGQSKKVKAIKKINDKEQRWMMDLNHKISRQLINLLCCDGPVGQVSAARRKKCRA
jgi:hypothetical protein